MFLPLVERLAPQLPSLEGDLRAGRRGRPAGDARSRSAAYESLIAGQPAELDWPSFDETTACGLCYTSGTTGMPKGALYHHRSTVLHALAIALPDAMGLSSPRDRAAGGADVPRQRLGPALRLPAGRRAAW